jgi:hypothetical protein
MICHHYRQTILELAAAGPETKADPKLQAHLQTCSSCRSAFENERSLFASIDSCLRSSTNAEIPRSFIPTVRAQLQRESPAARVERITNPLFWLPAIAAAAIILFIFASQDHRVKSQPTADQVATARIESPVATATTTASPSQATTAPIHRSSNGKRHPSDAIISPDQNPVRASSSAPEILVPPDQEILLARYADQFRRHHQSSATLLTEVAPDQTAPLQVLLIQIAELEVKPLADTQRDSQQDDIREK